MRKGALLPLDMEGMAARKGHVSQGVATCYYVNAAMTLYAEVRRCRILVFCVGLTLMMFVQ